MTPQELTLRAQAYVEQAIGRLNEVEAKGPIPEAGVGEWVSLRRNLESAQSDLATLTKGA